MLDAKQFETYFAQYEPVHDEMVTLLNALPVQLKQATDSAVTAYTAQLNHELQRDLKSMQVNLVKTIRDNVKNEVKTILI